MLLEANLVRVILRGDSYSIFWLDPAETILFVEVTGRWEWREAFTALEAVNRAIVDKSPQIVYTVYNFLPMGVLLPRGSSSTPSLKKLLDVELPNERMILLINNLGLYNTVTVLGKVLSVSPTQLAKLRGVRTLSEALMAIRRDQQRPAEAVEPS